MASDNPAQAQFSDSSDDFKDRGAYLVIEDTRGNKFGNINGDGENKIKFKAFLTAFSDKYTSNWNSTEVYGRMDPIHTFQNTSRSITVSLVIPSVSYKEGIENLQRVQALERLMYPNYETATNDSGKKTGPTSITEAPVFKVQFANLIQDAKSGGGLHCIIPDVAFNPTIDAGFYADGNKEFKQLVPKEMTLDLTLNILHMHEMGWSGAKFEAAENFPANKAPSGIGILELAGKSLLGSTTASKTTRGDREVSVAEIIARERITGTGHE